MAKFCYFAKYFSQTSKYLPATFLASHSNVANFVGQPTKYQYWLNLAVLLRIPLYGRYISNLACSPCVCSHILQLLWLTSTDGKDMKDLANYSQYCAGQCEGPDLSCDC